MPQVAPKKITIPPSRRSAIRRRLLHWYDHHKRDLPWRNTHDPYAIWVSEIMLQQTRVDTVLNYYDRFLKRFPTVASLAQATDDDILQIWQGLGHYRRVFHLRNAAKVLMDQNGVMPSTADELRQLPGIGHYTAAAIASIAFDQPIAAVDGNVFRVISRLHGHSTDRSDSTKLANIQAVAQQLLHPSRPGDFNQAWMDLGSSICTPKNPQCTICPLNPHCQAVQRGSIQSPNNQRRSKKPASPIVHCVVGLLQRNRRVLIQRRPPTGLWSGLWEFPNHPRTNGSTATESLTLISELGLGSKGTPTHLGQIQHVLTHRTYRFDVFTCNVIGRPTVDSQSLREWIDPEKLCDYPMSRAQRRISEFLLVKPKLKCVINKTT